ncbi:MAG TPA: type II and III secretion system protein [Tepidisphaeraceae bacterium]|jgi:Flp pilus assembly secretin CpaC
MRQNLKDIAWASLVLCLMHVAGCAQQPVATPPVTAHESGGFNPPQIISSRPKEDAAAYAASDEQLSTADWHELLELGPRPIWERLAGHHGRPHQCGDPRGAVPPLDLTSATQPEDDGAKPPAIQPATTRPAAVALDEAELPAEVIPLPGEKLRIIWTFRNVGGTTVKSVRDAITARRTLDVAQPDLAPLVAVLTQTLGPGGAVTALPHENTIVITCDKAMRTPVLSLLNDLDHPARQVEIAAKIFEVSHDFDFQQGTELVLNRLASQGGQALVSTFSAKRFLDAMNSGSSAPVQGSVLRLLQVFQSAGVSLDISFQLLADAGLIQVVSEPRMTVAVGQTGYLLAGQEVPIQSTNVVNNVLQIGTTYKPVGVQLYITPEAAGPARVKLHTVSIVSAVSGFNAVQSMEGGAAPVQNPVIDSREAETAVTVSDRSTLVISGLRMIRTTTREEKIPGLGDVPVLGWLFKNHRSQQEQTDLYFFITPTML